MTFPKHSVIDVWAGGRGGGGGGGGGGPPPPPPPPPQYLGNSDFLGSKRKFGQRQFLKTFPCFSYYYFEEINIFYNNRNNPVTFTRESDCLARDEFLVIREGYHKLIFLLLGTVLQWAISSRELSGINFRLDLLSRIISARRTVYGR